MPAVSARKTKQARAPTTAPPTHTTAATAKSSDAQPAQDTDNKLVRLHVTPFTPALLKAYLAPSVLPLAKNVSFHTIETFPEKGFGFVELPAMEAQKLKKKLNGSTLKGSKVRIEEAKPEKRKVADEVEDELEDDSRIAKRAKKEKKKKEKGVLEGVELANERKVKRGWTEPTAKNKKEKKDKKDKDKRERKASKYTKEPELLFKAKLTPVAATEAARKEKKDKKKDKSSRSKNEVVVHEFEKSTKQPSFLKSAAVSTEKKTAVEYINGTGWVDEDGNVVEAETGKARNRRVLELVDKPALEAVLKPSVSPQPTTEKTSSTAPDPESSKTRPKSKKGAKVKKVTPSLSLSESESDESSVVSSSSDDENAASEAESSASSPALAPNAPSMILTPSSPDEKKEVHPLEALFKRPKPPSISTPDSKASSTPAKGLAINTSFSFFDADAMDVDASASGNPPVTPFTQKDLEWRGLRSAAPTPDTAALGRRFSFPWRKGSQEINDDDESEGEDNVMAANTKANASSSRIPEPIAEEDEDEEQDDGDAGSEHDDEDGDAMKTPLGKKKGVKDKDEDEDKEESEFQKWFWENRGENNRAWKKRRREGLKAKRLRENRKITGARRVG
ncbi:hypothetical protein BCR34DRAFT_559794 [Clohesyomyces aquaticus]|uniref:RRM domain-containing protein n=1 Tax=Clohesyomyces aquaticus TaxID=1231657 RepID=A0A1Y1ZX28_9PLEO|nr:hypothetical protein BCR34DRAFT_559794 [Clohesyomyces aquaticus]